MHLESAAQAKGRMTCPHRAIPREGSHVRAVYDLFMAHKGVPVEFLHCARHGGRPVETLRDTYGLDIRCIRPGKWVLAGEWCGSRYRDYIAEHLGLARERVK